MKIFPNDPKSLGHSGIGPNISKIIGPKIPEKFRAAYWVRGGGGGLLVNGKGPHRRSNDGEGYGGGGGGSSPKEFHYAGPGAVLLEIGTAPTTTPFTTQITTKTSTCP